MKYGVFTKDWDYAKNCIDNFGWFTNDYGAKIDMYKCSKYDIQVRMTNGDTYTWVKPSDNARGRKFDCATIDISTCSLEAIQNVVLPSCVFADRDNIKIGRSKPHGESKLFSLIEELEKVAAIKGNMPVYYNNYDCPPDCQLGIRVEDEGINLCD